MNQSPRHPASVAELAFYASPPHECSYIPGQESVTLFADPEVTMRPSLYSQLALMGFRRSGDYVYRPHCPECSACHPVRIPVHRFKPNRSQRRNWKANQDLQVAFVSPQFKDEHFRLYQRYIRSRHAGGSMDVDDPEQYMQFLNSHWSDTAFIEFRLSKQLLAVAVVDILDTGLSAVYTFFDADYPARGLGTYAVLWEIEAVKRCGLNWLYLGYWIKSSPKMAYKSAFRPLELFKNGRWQSSKVRT